MGKFQEHFVLQII